MSHSLQFAPILLLVLVIGVARGVGAEPSAKPVTGRQSLDVSTEGLNDRTDASKPAEHGGSGHDAQSGPPSEEFRGRLAAAEQAVEQAEERVETLTQDQAMTSDLAERAAQAGALQEARDELMRQQGKKAEILKEWTAAAMARAVEPSVQGSTGSAEAAKLDQGMGKVAERLETAAKSASALARQPLPEIPPAGQGLASAVAAHSDAQQALAEARQVQGAARAAQQAAQNLRGPGPERERAAAEARAAQAMAESEMDEANAAVETARKAAEKARQALAASGTNPAAEMLAGQAEEKNREAAKLGADIAARLDEIAELQRRPQGQNSAIPQKMTEVAAMHDRMAALEREAGQRMDDAQRQWQQSRPANPNQAEFQQSIDALEKEMDAQRQALEAQEPAHQKPPESAPEESRPEQPTPPTPGGRVKLDVDFEESTPPPGASQPSRPPPQKPSGPRSGQPSGDPSESDSSDKTEESTPSSSSPRSSSSSEKDEEQEKEEDAEEEKQPTRRSTPRSQNRSAPVQPEEEPEESEFRDLQRTPPSQSASEPPPPASPGAPPKSTLDPTFDSSRAVITPIVPQVSLTVTEEELLDLIGENPAATMAPRSENSVAPTASQTASETAPRLASPSTETNDYDRLMRTRRGTKPTEKKPDAR